MTYHLSCIVQWLSECMLGHYTMHDEHVGRLPTGSNTEHIRWQVMLWLFFGACGKHELVRVV